MYNINAAKKLMHDLFELLHIDYIENMIIRAKISQIIWLVVRTLQEDVSVLCVLREKFNCKMSNTLTLQT